MKKYLLQGLFVLVVVGLVFLLNTKADKPIDKLRFSNTMSWDEKLLAHTLEQTLYITNWQNKIRLQPPPSNSSFRTQEELKLLLEYQKNRSESQITQIIQEVNISSAIMADRPVNDYFDSAKFPSTAKLLHEAFHDLTVVVFFEKRHFDRVRPSMLEPNIKPVIDVPNHPSYPSGHSTQAHLIALLLSELVPDREKSLLEKADAIAKNREIAGLHYPSDSEAGRQLARQFKDLILENPEFEKLLEQAKQEWSNNSEECDLTCKVSDFML